MFNENIKNEFIEEYMRSRVVSLTSLNSLFNKVAPFERELHKDVSLFKENEIIDMYKKFDLKTVNTLQNYNNYLKAYCAFVAYKTASYTNGFSEIIKDVLKSCISEKTKQNRYITYEQLQTLEHELLNYTEAAIMECLWSGIAGKNLVDLTYLTRSQVDKTNMTITFKTWESA